MMLVATASYADSDWTFIGLVKANNAEIKNINLINIKNTIEILPLYGKITCQFYFNDLLINEQSNTNYCKINSIGLKNINIKIINTTNQNIDYKIYIHQFS